MTQESQSPSARRLAVVIPMANEETTVEEVIGKVLGKLSAADRIFCVIDNASRDSTLSRLRQIAVREPRLTVVWAPENRCVVDAYFRGYREALAAGYAWILEMDGGMSHDPEQIPRHIAAMEQGYDFAAGSRFIQGGSHQGSPSRWLVSWGGTLLTNLLLGTRMRDMTGGFECFTHRALSHVVAHGVQSRAHFSHTEIRYLLQDWRWIEVPITYRNPSVSVGKETLMESLRILWSLYRQKRAPLTT